MFIPLAYERIFLAKRGLWNDIVNVSLQQIFKASSVGVTVICLSCREYDYRKTSSTHQHLATRNSFVFDALPTVSNELGRWI